MVKEHTITIKGKQYPCDMPLVELISEPVPIFAILSKQVQELNEKLYKNEDKENE